MKNPCLRQILLRMRRWVCLAGGSVLIYVIAVMTVFGLLGAAMMAMFSSATMMSTGTPNYTRQARYMAESGMRYAVSELRREYDPDTVSRLNTTGYTISGAGSFDLNVFGRWFEAATNYDIASGNVNLNIPEGEVPQGFSLPVNLNLLNLEGFRDAKVFGGNAESFVSEIQSAPDMTTDPIIVNLGDSFIADQNQAVLPAVMADNSYSPSPASSHLLAGSTLLVDAEAGSVFPRENGSFYIESTLNEKKRYFYEKMVPGDPVQLQKISEDLDVSMDDWVALTEQNHILVADGASGAAGSGGSQELAMDFRPNVASPQAVPVPPPLSLPPDVAPTDFISGEAATPESDGGAVTVDTTAGQEKIVLGGNTASTSGAVFFGGDVSLGGLDVCTNGKCTFFDGIRAFFVFDYTGSGDGFTFTVANASTTANPTGNNLDAYGATGGALGYAGVSPTGKQIAKPKMAVEFDTFTNAGQSDPDDASWANRDMIQFDYWGTDAASVWDDVRHDEDSGGREQKWEFTSPSGEIYTKPAVDPVDGSIYVGSRDNYLWSIKADGTLKWRSNMGDEIYSSPVIGSDRTVYVGSNFGSPGGDINALADTGSFRWYYSVGDDVRSSPAIDSNDILYFGTYISDTYFYAVDSASPSTYKWRYNLGALDVDGAVALSPDESTVYFVTKDPGYLYALSTSSGNKKWDFSLNEKTQSAPRVADDGTIYVGSEDDYLYAVTDEGTMASLKWRYYVAANVRTRPAVGPDGTVYFGSDQDHKLHALTDEGLLKWEFLTAGNVRGAPLVHDDGSIWFGSDDDHVYALDADGNQLADYNVGADVRAEPSQGSDGTVYVAARDGDVFAFAPACQPQNIKHHHYSYDDLLPADIHHPISSANDWLESGPWAVRIEMLRSRSLNSRGRYEYTLRLWIRQCQETDCSDILGTYFEDTRVEYAAKDPHLTQTAELCAADHTKLDTFIFGFTEGTGSDVQTVNITDVQLGFIRPGDFVIGNDPDWP